jgi:hypothetical protein
MKKSGLYFKGEEVIEGDILTKVHYHKEGRKRLKITTHYVIRYVDGAFWAQGADPWNQPLYFATPELLTKFLREEDIIRHNELMDVRSLTINYEKVNF